MFRLCFKYLEMKLSDPWEIYNLMKGDGYEPWASIALFAFIVAVAVYLPGIIRSIDKENRAD